MQKSAAIPARAEAKAKVHAAQEGLTAANQALASLNRKLAVGELEHRVSICGLRVQVSGASRFRLSTRREGDEK
eukprot:703225-Rhodomonas_salina.1